MALELGPNNIRVNCVLPTVVMTELGKKVWSEPKKYNEMMSKIPLKRFAGAYNYQKRSLHLTLFHKFFFCYYRNRRRC